jgi:RimJ/RimL family protein N-acetyltransferase
MAAEGTGLVWCVADREDDRCLASVSLEGFGGYSRRAEIGYWAHPEVRGRGLVTEAARLVTLYAESHDLVDSILVRVAGRNTASRHVAVSAGYREVGVLPRAEPLGDGTLADLVLYARP